MALPWRRAAALYRVAADDWMRVASQEESAKLALAQELLDLRHDREQLLRELDAVRGSLDVARRDRGAALDELVAARKALGALSTAVVGSDGLEPSTVRLKGACSTD